MSTDPWFSISGIAISYVFLIVLGVAIVATCSSMLAFIACCDCIDCNISQDTNIVDTSIMIINDDMSSGDNNDEDDSEKKLSLSLVDHDDSNQKPDLNESQPTDELVHKVQNSNIIIQNEKTSTNKSRFSSQNKIETQVCIEPNAGQSVISKSSSIHGTNENNIQNEWKIEHESVCQHRRFMFTNKRVWRCHPITINPDSTETEIW